MRSWEEVWQHLISHAFAHFNAKWELDGHTFVCQCPCHDDHNPSFAVTKNEATGMIVGICRSKGCDSIQAFGHFGVTARELRRDSSARKSEEDQVIARHVYNDENGKMLFERRRTAGKDFFPYRMIGTNEWACGLQGGWYYRGNGGIWFRRKDQTSHTKTDKRLPAVRTVPYRLDSIVESKNRDLRLVITEGESDANTLFELLDDKKYVVTTFPFGAMKSAGSKSWHDGLLDFFTNRRVILCYDRDKIGRDGTGPGQVHAQILANKIGPVAKELLIVEQEVTWKGKDVRDWANSGMTAEDFDKLIDGATVWSEGHTIAGSVPEMVDEVALDHVLTAFGLIPLGVTQDGRFLLWSEVRQRNVSLSMNDLNKMARSQLISMSNLERVTRHLCTGETKSLPEQWWTREISDAIAERCGRRLLDGRKFKGMGIWRVPREGEDSLVLVNGNSVSALNGSLEKLHSPCYGEDVFRIGDGPPWFDHDRLMEMMQQAQDPEWRNEVANEILELVNLWKWARKSDPILVVAEMMATWIQTVLPVRPQPSIIGESTCGKTKLAETLKSFYGNLGLMLARPTEPGLRESAMGNALAIQVDEYDRCTKAQRRAILELRRLATTGSVRSLGTGNGEARWYQIWYMIWLFGIDSALADEADLNRALIHELKTVPKAERKLDKMLPAESILQDLGMRCLACLLVVWRDIDSLYHMLMDAEVGDVGHRVAQMIAVPIATYGAFVGEDASKVAEVFQAVLRDRQDASLENTTDDAVLLEDILNIELRVGAQTYLVSTLVRWLDDGCDGPPDMTTARAEEALASVGMAMMDMRPNGVAALFIRPKSVEKRFSNDPRWGGATLREYLVRSRGARITTCRVGGDKPKGVAIPLETLFNRHEDTAD